jgi:uncharacterized membrane protein YhaH (DUF805 family)
MWYIEALRKYAVFEGRAGRPEFWHFVLANVIVGMVLRMIDHIGDTYGFFGPNYGLFGGLYTLAVFIPGLAVTIRRLHDSNVSGNWFLIIFVPLLGFLILLSFLIRVGTIGTNRFGPPPRSAPT